MHYSLRRTVQVFVALAVLAQSAVALDLGNRATTKPARMAAPPPTDPERIRQGGDTILDAILISVPAATSGSTAGFTDDYDEVCPYQGSTSPDVVYLLQPAADLVVKVDMFGSSYDTKIYVYDESLELVACNDDYYSDYVSRIENLALNSGAEYYLVIDGYGGEAGDYVLDVAEFVPCVVDCPSSGWIRSENEPPLVDGYQDAHNGGCNSPEFGNPFGYIDSSWYSGICGTSGWYDFDGSSVRDTDWYLVRSGPEGYIEIFAVAEQPTYVFELAPQDCGSYAVVQSIELVPCEEGYMNVPVTADECIWMWVGPTVYEGPVNEYAYYIQFYPPPVATVNHSWSEVKALFR